MAIVILILIIQSCALRLGIRFAPILCPHCDKWPYALPCVWIPVLVTCSVLSLLGLGLGWRISRPHFTGKSPSRLQL